LEVVPINDLRAGEIVDYHGGLSSRNREAGEEGERNEVRETHRASTLAIRVPGIGGIL
jgi:hypothetical protein